MGAIGSSMGVPTALAIGGVLSVITGVGSWFGLNRIRAARRPSLRVPSGAAVAAADIGAIDPEGRSAGSGGGGRRA
jgi:hypothetical protein